MPEDFELEPEEQEEPRFRDRNRGRSMYVRRALVKIGRLSPEARAAYKPLNGFEEAALATFARCMTEKFGNSSMQFVLKALGEEVSKNAKEDKPEPNVGIVDDLPRARTAKAN